MRLAATKHGPRSGYRYAAPAHARALSEQLRRERAIAAQLWQVWVAGGLCERVRSAECRRELLQAADKLQLSARQQRALVGRAANSSSIAS